MPTLLCSSNQVNKRPTGITCASPQSLTVSPSTSVSGFIQLIGCFGALRLSERLLNTYWLLLLLLLIGDAMLGVFWMFKFEFILNDLQRSIK